MNNDTNTKRYVGITIGPIDRILEYAGNTRSIWASSYLFSYIGKQIASSLRKQKAVFLKPSVSPNMFSSQEGVGRFPDQYVACTHMSVEDLRTTCNDILKTLADDMAKVLKVDVADVERYLSGSLRIIIVERSYPANTPDEKVVGNFQTIFDAMECRDAYCATETRNYLAEYFQMAPFDSLLYKDAFGDKKASDDNRLFKTILEYSVGDDVKNYSTDQLLAEPLRVPLKLYQKYIAFVSADGDNFGKTVARMGDSVGKFFDSYVREIRELVHGYGGKMIYQGGDEFHFFAPIFNRGKDIFHLLGEIDKKYNEILSGVLSKNNITVKVKKPTLSYGVSISYYKFPMAEARSVSHSMLYEAKNGTSEKNKICWQVRKHSGQLFGGTFDKNRVETFTQALPIIHNATSGDANFLHSVTHWLICQQAALSVILAMNERDRSSCLGQYIDNSFNEPGHAAYSPFFGAIKSYLLAFNNTEGIAPLHAILRYVELLMNKKQ